MIRMRIRTEEKWMQRALELAKKAGDETRPNPRVGAVVVKDGKVVGAGFHRRAGEAHAEVKAIDQAGFRARGADLYVTLEPCSTHGRTPPCTGAIQMAGVRKVIYGASDVDPRNAGKADNLLKRAGIGVARGVLRKECERLNEDYRHWKLEKKPWVILKLAMTLDGSLAVPGRRWITGPQARAEVQKIRAGCDAILVGAETVRKDNPRLTVRLGKRGFQPWRVVVTRKGKMPRQATLFTDPHCARTLVYRNQNWGQIFKDLYGRGVRRLMVEGGAKTAAGLIAAGKVNEVILFFAPETVEKGHPRVTDWGAWKWQRASIARAGQDLCLRGILKGAN